MGVEPYLCSSTLEAVMGQRLLRSICPRCKTSYKPDRSILEQLGLSETEIGDRELHYGEGCQECNNTGYKGRRGIYEYLQVSNPIAMMINERKPTLLVRNKAIELGMRTLREDGVRNILNGYTTVEEVLKYT
jgi:type IV pilus assembly protein PilB